MTGGMHLGSAPIRSALGTLLVGVVALADILGGGPRIVSAEPLPGTACAMFPADSVFNTDVAGLPVSSASAAWMANMTQNSNLHPDFGTFAQEYGIPINVAPPPSSGLTPTFSFDSESDHPAEGYPIQPATNIEGGPSAPSGSDRHALVLDQSRCKLYEIYNLQNFTTGQTPQAGSGATWDLSSNGMRPLGWTSADAAGLPIAPLLLRPDEIQAGAITHAIRFTSHCTSGFIWPASHQAGLCSTGFPPMGARFRLKRSFDISHFSANTQVVLTAFQRYGLILADNGSDWYFQGTTDDWWGTTAGSALVADLKTIPASQFEAVDESGIQAAAASYGVIPAAKTAVLPQDRLHFGLANQPSDLAWMTTSGVPWRYRYQYLAGGVNTNAGWETWNSPSGAFATLYMNASGASGYIPVFSYYELLQSTPSSGTNESDRDFSNLNNATTMNSYYANFKLLMQLAGEFGKPVVVQVEPDLWGYLEQRAAGGAASSLSASVASSGFGEAAGFPNTAAGFAYELLRLRDTYAPNALLAIHASPWGSGIDIASDRSSTVNPVTEADTTAAFLNSAGVGGNPFGSTWDLVFNDLDDHDAGWWEQQGADNSSFTHWWDPSNTTFPNFNRYLAWVSELHMQTARPQVAWQVPVGNQYFETMNNTCGHYQDNVAPYFISHAGSLSAAGLIAVLFGAGNSCQTDNTDAQHDGITNNNGAPTTDVAGYCNACNTHASSYADDDGGYLRIFVGQYYATGHWRPLGGLTPAAPAAVAPSGAYEDLFVRGNDNALWRNHWDGIGWVGWTSLGGITYAAPGAAALSSSQVEAFVRGNDNQLYRRVWNGSAWTPWMALGGILTSGPAASVMPGTPQTLSVWVAGSDLQLYYKSSTDGGNTFGPWLALGGRLTSAPAAVSWSAGRIDVFVRGTDYQLWHRAWTAGGWSGWEPLGGILTSAPAVASCSANRIDVFVRGADAALWRKSWNGSAWSSWQSMGGSWNDGPAAACRSGTNTVDLFERAADNSIWTTSVAGT